MICPKCGFRQPEEIYCANCGVNVVKFSRRKRKRLYARLILLACVSTGVVAAAGLFYALQERDRKDLVEGVPPKRALFKGTISKAVSLRGPKNPSEATTPSLSKGPDAAGETPSFQLKKSSANPTESTAPEGEPAKPAATGEQNLTAGQWYEAGRSLNDDSAEEMKCYQAAIEADPSFAPAYYALGGIHFRLAEYDQADRYFGKFLELASEEERQTYDIYVYYSPEEAETLTQRAKADGARIADREKAQSSPPPKGEQNQGEGNGAPPSDRELKTVVPFKSVRGHIGVPVLLNGGVEASMLLDTGAGVTLLSKKVASALGLPLSEKGAVNLKTVSGDIRAPVTRLESIKLGDLKKVDFQVAVSDLNLAEGRFDGILGMDFLEDFDIRINNQSGRITLRREARN